MSDRLTVRSQAGDFTLHLGNFSTRGRLIPIRKSEEQLYGKKPKMCTPALEAVDQVYRGPDGTIYEKEALSRGYQQKDKSFRPVRVGDLVEAKKSVLPYNELELTAHPIEDIERFTFPSDSNAYVFDTLRKTDKGKWIPETQRNLKMHDFIYSVLETGEIGLIGEGNFQNHQGLFRVFIYQGNLAMQRILVPDELNQYEEREINLTETELAKVKAMVSNIVTPFNPTDYKNTIALRVAAIESKSEDDESEVEVVEEVEEFDLLEALDGFEL